MTTKSDYPVYEFDLGVLKLRSMMISGSWPIRSTSNDAIHDSVVDGFIRLGDDNDSDLTYGLNISDKIKEACPDADVTVYLKAERAYIRVVVDDHLLMILSIL